MKVDAIQDPIREAEELAPSSDGLNALDILIVLSRRRRFIALFTIVLTILAAIIVLLIPSQYTAAAVVMPPAQSSSLGSVLTSQLGGGAGALASAAGAGLGIKNPADMYVALFRSRTVEDGMVQRFGLMALYRVKRLSDARTAFENHSTVSLGAKDGLIRITVRSHDPKLASELTNGYVDEFRKLSATMAITEASQRRIFFQQQLREANDNLSTSEEAMKQAEQSTGILQIDNQARALIESGATIRAQIAAKEVQLQSMHSYATEDNPNVIEAKEQLSALQVQLAKLSGSESTAASDIIVPKGNIPAAGMEYLRRLRDVKYYEAVSELIAKQFEIAKLDEAREGAIIQVVDNAVAPDKRSFPKRTLTVALTAVFGLMFACAWSLFSEKIRQSNQDPKASRRIAELRAALKS